MKNKLTENTILDGIHDGKTIAMNCYTLTDNFVKNLEISLSPFDSQHFGHPFPNECAPALCLK